MSSSQNKLKLFEQKIMTALLKTSMEAKDNVQPTLKPTTTKPIFQDKKISISAAHPDENGPRKENGKENGKEASKPKDSAAQQEAASPQEAESSVSAEADLSDDWEELKPETPEDFEEIPNTKFEDCDGPFEVVQGHLSRVFMRRPGRILGFRYIWEDE